MSYIDRKSSFNIPSRSNSINTYGSRHGSIITYDDYDSDDYSTMHVPKSILDRRMSAGLPTISHADSPVPQLVGTSPSDSVYLIRPNTKVSPLKWLVVLYCFLYMAAYVMSSATFVQYIYKRIQTEMFPDKDKYNISVNCYSNTSDPHYKKQISVQEKASNWNMYYSLAAGIPAMFASIIMGASTDRFGRKFLFYLPCLGALVRLSVCTAGIHFNFNRLYFLIGFFVEGLTGYMATMLLVTFTYVADITPPKGKQRSFGITMIELINGIAMTVFSFATGYFIQDMGYFYPMLTSGALVFLCLFITIFIPESFPKDKRNLRESTFEKIKTIYNLFLGESNRGRRWMYNTLMFVFLLTMFTSFGRQSVEPLYQLDTPFCWSPEKLGYFSALKNLLQQIFGMGVIKLFQQAMSDEAIAMLGCVSFGASFVLEGFAQTDILMYIVPALGVCGLLTIPITRSLLSKLTYPEHQGAIFSTIATMETAINIGGSVAANEIYSHTLNFYRGFVFFVFTGCNFICLIAMAIYRFGSRRTFPTPLDIRR
ncbi:solute carrier family 46 member 3-like [Mercenaria mercenaria]|uniref:solute carrier family 46 member 3-like n=1 Tax=Mercenaria mercenaria TaxID=6596 RepID=UPI00234F01C8|nr:solute carrier family 46 member 3-like [Mercenaria mercenaria]XP_045186646.2 solute carrier family 46 member 3-like [Mercenaria mercenaria]